MKMRIELTEDEIKQAIAEFVKKHKNLEIKLVSLTYHHFAGDDPRERSYHSATASE